MWTSVAVPGMDTRRRHRGEHKGIKLLTHTQKKGTTLLQGTHYQYSHIIFTLKASTSYEQSIRDSYALKHLTSHNILLVGSQELEMRGLVHERRNRRRADMNSIFLEDGHQPLDRFVLDAVNTNDISTPTGA